MQIEIDANKRELQGKGASRRLRTIGKVPGVVYGGGGTAQSIELDHNNLFHKLRQEAFHASVLSLNIEGVKEQVLLRDVQMHPYKPQVLHVDFQRIDRNKKMHMKVPLHFINAELSPGVKLSGGMISHVLTEVDILCLPKDLPEYITVDLAEMTVGSTLHLSDLKLPENVEASALIRGDNLPVATLIVQRGGESEEGGAGA